MHTACGAHNAVTNLPPRARCCPIFFVLRKLLQFARRRRCRALRYLRSLRPGRRSFGRDVLKVGCSMQIHTSVVSDNEAESETLLLLHYIRFLFQNSRHLEMLRGRATRCGIDRRTNEIVETEDNRHSSSSKYGARKNAQYLKCGVFRKTMPNSANDAVTYDITTKIENHPVLSAMSGCSKTLCLRLFAAVARIVSHIQAVT